MNKADVLFSGSWNDFEINHVKRKGNFSMPSNHYHDSYELYYLLSGERYYFIKDRTLHIKQGDLILINRYELHKTLDVPGSPSHERILVNFKPSYLSGMLPGIGFKDLYEPFEVGMYVIKFDGCERVVLESLFSKMLQEARDKLEGYETMIRTGLIDMLVLINRNVISAARDSYTHPTQVHRKISEIVMFINENYMKELSLGLLSSKFFISSFHLSRVFREVTGFSYIEYLNSIRIKEAQRLLGEANMSITEIAGRVGYESITHFGRVFKSITGLSPSSYRKLNRPQMVDLQ